MSQTFATPSRRIPHPFAADYSPPRPRTRPSFPFTDVSTIAHTRIPSPPPPPASPIPPVPSIASASTSTKRAKAPRRVPREFTPRSTFAATSSTRVPISAPVPLSSPPPPVYQPVVESSQAPQSSSDLLRPDSRIQRERKKAKKVSPWDLKHVRASSPASKGLWTLFEVDEDWVRISEELQRRPVSYAYLAPFISTNPSTPCRNTPSPAKLFLSARPSGEVLVPSRPVSASPERAEDDHEADVDAMEILTDSESAFNHIVTPQMEEEDPFALDGAWIESPTRHTKFVSPSHSARESRFRRPPPLALASSNKSRPSSFSSIVLSDADLESPSVSPTPAPRSKKSPKLLSPIALVSPGVQQARRRSASGPPDMTPPRNKRPSTRDAFEFPPTPLDLESALEDFLACCGERSSDLETSSSSDSNHESMSDSDLFYRRPESSAYTSSEDEARAEELFAEASAFPLPPARQHTPPRPARGASRTLGLAIDMGSPSIFSPGPPETPVTPPSMHCRQLLPSLPIVPCRASRSQEDYRPITKLQGDHSFLQSLSQGEEFSSPLSGITSCPLSPASQISSVGSSTSGSSGSSGASSRGSGSSGRSLPKRGGIPASWKLYAAANRI